MKKFEKEIQECELVQIGGDDVKVENLFKVRRSTLPCWWYPPRRGSHYSAIMES